MSIKEKIKKYFSKRGRVLTSVFLAMFFLLSLFPAGQKIFSVNNEGNYLYGDETAYDSVSGYDFVLIIDESGSMKKNDPNDLRKDAAKLFVYLAEVMNKGNRVLVSGFGETTNIYAPMIDITDNQAEISTAIDRIRSDQGLTDMKGALEKIKLALDERNEKQNTIVIFLTDGALTLDDIPPAGTGDDKQTRNKPEKPSGREGDDQQGPVNPEDPNIFANGATGVEKTSFAEEVATPATYLEEYKQMLIDLCYNYKDSGIIIHPIAFTKETDVAILEQMAFITGGICWKPQQASDLKDSFLEILANITSRFIKTEEQSGSESLTGEFDIKDYINELIVLSSKNNFTSDPGIEILKPSGDEAVYDEYFEEKIFKIVKINSLQPGQWKYSISGDGIFIYDIGDSTVREPEFDAYTAGVEIPLVIDISKILDPEGENSTDDFTVKALVTDPEGTASADIVMNDSASGNDTVASDGNFAGVFKNTEQQGYYNLSFSILNEPTGSTLHKNASFAVYKLPVRLGALSPSDNYFKTGSEVAVSAEIKAEDNPAAGDIDYKDYAVSTIVTSEEGTFEQELVLFDNGQGADSIAGDGIYTSTFKKTDINGKYIIKYFIQDILKMDIFAFTGLQTAFYIKDAPEILLEITNNPFTGEDTIIRASFEDLSEGEFKYSLVAPDGSEASGGLLDNGSVANGDEIQGDGIYSMILKGLGSTGKYDLSIEGLSSLAGGDIPLSIKQSFSKDFEVSGIADTLELDKKPGFVEITFDVVSTSDKDATISISTDEPGNTPFRTMAIIGDGKILAGKENKIVLRLELDDEIKPGEYATTIPLELDNTYLKNIDLTLTVPGRQISSLLLIVINAGAAVIVALILLLYFFYIKPKRKNALNTKANEVEVVKKSKK